MKKIFLLIILSVFSSWAVVIACSNPKEPNTAANKEPVSATVNEQDVREAAFYQLTSKDKVKIAGTWKDSKLSKLILKEGMGNITDKSYIGKEVYLIDFQTQSKSMPNNIIVYLSIDNKKLLGYGYVE